MTTVFFADRSSPNVGPKVARKPAEIAEVHAGLHAAEERFSSARAELRATRSALLISRDERLRAEARYDLAIREMREWCERRPRVDGFLGCLDSTHECGAP